MLLAIDIGNSNITLGVSDGEDFENVFRIISDKNASESDYEFLIKKMITDYKITECIISSVVDELTDVIKNVCCKIFEIKPFVITSNSKFPFKINVDEPEKVGMDRLINTSALSSLNSAVIVADFGTAITLDVVSREKEFLGGVIMAGIRMQAKALKEKTSKLPEAEVRESKYAIGKNTTECINSGILRGTACAVEGLINQIEQELGEKAVIAATGGFCETVAKYMKRKFDIVDKNLTLKGLKVINDMNKVINQ